MKEGALTGLDTVAYDVLAALQQPVVRLSASLSSKSAASALQGAATHRPGDSATARYGALTGARCGEDVRNMGPTLASFQASGRHRDANGQAQFPGTRALTSGNADAVAAKQGTLSSISEEVTDTDIQVAQNKTAEGQAEGEEGDEDEMVVNGHELGQPPGASEGTGRPGIQPMGSQRVGHDLLTEQLKNQAKIRREGLCKGPSRRNRTSRGWDARAPMAHLKREVCWVWLELLAWGR